MSNEPLSERQMHEEEYEALHGPLPTDYRRLRDELLSCPRSSSTGYRSEAEAESWRRRADERLTRELFARVHRLGDRGKPARAALCLSGGGIRSATFALGVLQGLARRGLLRQFDYLSTVSGGGYIGGWLTAWIHRHPKGLDGVNEELAAGTDDTGGAAGVRPAVAAVGDDDGAALNPEPLQVQHLRDYSNYLTPQLGALRPDSWTLVATYLRNLLLNWLILVPLLAAILLVPRMYLLLVTAYGDLERKGVTFVALLGAALALTLTAVTVAIVSLPSVSRLPPMEPRPGATGTTAAGRARARRARPSQVQILWGVVVPIVVASFATTWARAWFKRLDGVWMVLGICAGLYMLAAGAIRVVARLRKKPHPPRFVPLLLTLMLTGMAVGATSYGTSWLPGLRGADASGPGLMPAVYVTCLLPTCLLLYLLLITLFVGFTSEEPGRDDDREWWARLMGWTLMVAVGWGVVGALSLFSGALFRLSAAHPERIWAAVTAVTAAASSLGLFGARSASSGAGERRRAPTWKTWAADAVPGVAAHVAVAGLFILLAAGLERAVGWGAKDLNDLTGLTRSAGYRWTVVAAFAGLLALSFVCGKLINSNRLSLHAVYRDRLIRAYLGASNAERAPDPFTGFDPEDNVPMHHLRRQSLFTEADLGEDSATRDRRAPDDPKRKEASREQRAAELARMLLVRAMPFHRHVWELGKADDLELINAEHKRVEHEGGTMDGARLVRPVLNVLNEAVCDLQLVWKSRFRDAAERAKRPEIERAFARLESDGCPNLLNRLILEEEYYRDREASGWRPSEDGSRLRVISSLPVPRPLHVVNLALNLVEGEKLAWQQRKATSFTVSPMHSGFTEGYRPSVDYGGGITLGTAVTISGAAASPNMGYHSSPAVTFLMTLFNVRLGWWLGNPARVRPSLWDRALRKVGLRRAGPAPGQTAYQLAGPDHSMRPLIDEALGRTNDKNGYVYLSDGGHFENLGVYEMVRRRCRYVVVSDASCDADCNFEDLANAVRKVRIDMGIPIEIREILFFPKTKEIGEGRYCAVGDIVYGAVDDGAENGKLIYLKPAKHPYMPVDLYSHGETNRFFPHEPTANQWFSESQFESYRHLGYETVEQICRRWPGGSVSSLAQFVDAAEAEAATQATRVVATDDRARRGGGGPGDKTGGAPVAAEFPATNANAAEAAMRADVLLAQEPVRGVNLDAAAPPPEPTAKKGSSKERRRRSKPRK